MTTWSCPLCDFSTTSSHDVTPSVIKHATEQHPAYLPERQTVAEMLDMLPVLIREAWATMGAPNPGGELGRVPHVAGSRVPAEMWVIDAMKPDDGREEYSFVLISRLVECSRIIWESIDAETRKAHPQALGTPQWSSEVSWLSGVWADAQAWLDPCDSSWIEDEIKAIRGTLAAIVKMSHRPRFLCPTDGCREPMHADVDDWMICESGHQHPGPKRLESQWRRKAPMSTKDICAELRIPRRTLMWWQSERGLKPTRTEGRESYWLPWDVIALRYPDIVAEIDGRDAA